MVLPVYNYPTKVEAQAQSPQWDRAIEKCSKAIAKHTMFIKGVDKNIYMDEVYLLMGKAYFYRQDYTDANRIFSYLIQPYRNTNSWADAYTWKAQTFLCQNQLLDAEENLELIKADIGAGKSDSDDPFILFCFNAYDCAVCRICRRRLARNRYHLVIIRCSVYFFHRKTVCPLKNIFVTRRKEAKYGNFEF